MDTSEIKNMEAGKEMDDLVAEKVMGWHRCKKDDGWEYWGDEECRFRCGVAQYEAVNGLFEDAEDFNLLNWHPSGGLLWAFDVVDKLAEKGWTWQFELVRPIGGNQWGAYLWNWKKSYYAYDDNLPSAICRAVLMFALENEAK